MNFWTQERLIKASMIAAHFLFLFWVLYVVFNTKSIQAPIIALNYIGFITTGYFLFRFEPTNN